MDAILTKKTQELAGELAANSSTLGDLNTASRICSTNGVEFLSFQFHGYGGQIRVSPKSLTKFKQRARELLNRNHGKSTFERLQELTKYLRGWIGYFALEQRKSEFDTLD
jgi:RNA-directed DNA polymerase